MTTRAVSWRSLVGVAAVSAALGLSLVLPASASATSARPGSVPAVKALPVLSSGSTGTYVKSVQRILGVKVTGYYGTRTSRAVAKFQAAAKIRPANGVVGPATWVALKRKAATASRSVAAAPPVATSDPTMSAAAKSSRAARNAIPLAVWQTSSHGRAIVKRESGGRCSVVSPAGYRGKWQMDSRFWRGYGGLAFAPSADKATCAEQDQVAYRGWLTSWWRPWGG